MNGLIGEVWSYAWVPVEAWIVIGVLVWIATAVVAGLIAGRAIRNRDRQVPRRPPAEEKAAFDRYELDEARDN